MQQTLSRGNERFVPEIQRFLHWHAATRPLGRFRQSERFRPRLGSLTFLGIFRQSPRDFFGGLHILLVSEHQLYDIVLISNFRRSQLRTHIRLSRLQETNGAQEDAES